MARRMGFVGDQIVLEEEYDETYIPSEEDILSYAQEIGIDPEKEPELLWLARQGMTAVLPPEWKPCQDVTGEVYYFNFVSGESSWEHPNDIYYKELVIQEREKLMVLGSLKKKEKKKKGKKEKKKEKRLLKEPPLSGSQLAPIQAPLGKLAPLHGHVLPSASILPGLPVSDMENLMDFSLLTRGEKQGSLPWKHSMESTLCNKLQPVETRKPASQTKEPLGSVSKKRSDNTASLDEGKNEEDGSENEENSRAEEERCTSRLANAADADLQHRRSPAEAAGSLGEESSKSRHSEEGQESSLDSDAACPPTPNEVLPGDADSSLSGQSKEEFSGDGLLGKEDSEMDDDVSVGERSTAGMHVPGGPGQPGVASPAAEEADPLASLAATANTVSGNEEIAKEKQEEESAELETDGRLDDGKASEISNCKEDLQVSKGLDRELNWPLGLDFQSRLSEHVLDAEALLPVRDSPMSKAQELGEEEKDQSKASTEKEQSKRTKAAESEKDPNPCETPEEKRFTLDNPSPEEPGTQEPEEGSQDSLRDVEELAALQSAEPEKEITPELSLNKSREESLDKVAKELELELEKEKMRLLQEKEKKIQQFQEEMRQQEEEAAQKLHQQKEKSLRALKDLAKTFEEEESSVRKEGTERLSELRAKIASETEAEEERMRAEQEVALQKLREEWESRQAMEKESLESRHQLALEQMKLEMEQAQQKKMTELEQEKEQFLSEVKERLDREKKKAAEELEEQFATELQQMKSAAEEKHQKVISSLQTQLAEAQKSEEAQLHDSLQKAEQKAQQKAYQVAEYEREVSELMREKRQEVEEDHEKKMKKMTKEHELVLAQIRNQYEEEERKQRAELLEGLQSETARLRQLHEAEVKALQAELDEQLTALQHRHKEKERRVQDSENKLEMRVKNIKARSAQLLSQEEALRKKRQQLLDEDRQAEQGRDEAASAFQLRLEEKKKEHASLQESIWQLRRSLEELQDQKAELEAEVDLLQTRRQRLQKYVSKLDAAIKSKRETLKELDGEESVESPGGKPELHVQDLKEAIQTPSSRDPASPPSQGHEDSDFKFDHVKSYISAEGISIQNAKEFLVRQNRSLRKRHAALRAAKQQWCQDMKKAQEAAQDPDRSQLLEGLRKNLEEEAKQLDQMKSAVQNGQVLLKKKEEKLSQLESSLLEELSDEDTLKSAVCKKMVAFELSNSEDTDSMSSVKLHLPKSDLRTDLQPSPRLDEIQYLTKALQHITGELNGVIGVLESLNTHHSPCFTSMPCRVPLSTSLAGLRPGGSVVPPAGMSLDPLAWSTGLSCSRCSAHGQSVDSFLAEKWHKYFPGGFPSLGESSRPLDNMLGYVPAEEQIRLSQHSQFQRCDSDTMNIQGMINNNKKWLEDFRRDSKVPLCPGAPTSNPRLLQLGLDGKGEINLCHY
ncbi:centrosomal protein of 164 kDa isoform X2 [Cuculus canorus]|uniref:centrosomal protein of 164 kDa isoform X2 n=1 Tax=Cuculus canorus TaxID=55661 RepID=UPI0023AB3D09|nr:centrosomal protein of 164 kDa isoform X2 [Cuculus canorus]